MYAIQRGLHVLVTKPATQLLAHHIELIEAAKRQKVVCFVEHHKRSASFVAMWLRPKTRPEYTALIRYTVTRRLVLVL